MKKLTALLLAVMMLFAGVCAAETVEEAEEAKGTVVIMAEEATEAPAPAPTPATVFAAEGEFVFRNVLTWKSTKQDVIAALAEFGVAEEELEGVKEGVGYMVSATDLPVVKTTAELEVLLWKDMPFMFCYNAGFVYEEELRNGLNLKYGEPVTNDPSEFQAMFDTIYTEKGLADGITNYTQWNTGDTKIAIFTSHMSTAVAYINVAYAETVLSEIQAADAAAADAEAQAAYEAATSGL